MNLVAKEFVAARDDERGVLVLSHFAGAARELTEALIVTRTTWIKPAARWAQRFDMPVDEQQDVCGRCARSLPSSMSTAGRPYAGRRGAVAAARAARGRLGSASVAGQA